MTLVVAERLCQLPCSASVVSHHVSLQPVTSLLPVGLQYCVPFINNTAYLSTEPGALCIPSPI